MQEKLLPSPITNCRLHVAVAVVVVFSSSFFLLTFTMLSFSDVGIFLPKYRTSQ